MQKIVQTDNAISWNYLCFGFWSPITKNCSSKIFPDVHASMKPDREKGYAQHARIRVFSNSKNRVPRSTVSSFFSFATIPVVVVLAFLEPYQKRSCQKHWTNSTFEHWSFLQSEGVQSYTRAIFRVSNFLHFDTAIPPPLRSFSSIILYFLGLQTHQVNQTLNNNDFVIVPPTNHGR